MNVVKKLISNEDDLKSAIKSWTILENAPEMTVYQSYEWNRLLVKEWSGWNLHSLYSSCVVYMAYDGEDPIMIIPLIIQKISTKNKWFGAEKGIYLLGYGSYSDYQNVIYDTFNPDAFEELIKRIKGDYKGYTIFLTNIREDTSLAKFLISHGNEIYSERVAVSVKKRSSVEEYQADLSKQTKQNLRTALNRMNRDEVKFDPKVLGKIEDKSVIDELTRIHIDRLIIKTENNDDLAHRASSSIRNTMIKQREEKNNIIKYAMSELDNSFLLIVFIDEQIAGYLYGLREQNCIRVMQNCFDDQFKFYSPMFRASYDYILSTYNDPNIEEVDFTRGNEDYKYRLGGTEIKLYEFRL